MDQLHTDPDMFDDFREIAFSRRLVFVDDRLADADFQQGFHGFARVGSQCVCPPRTVKQEREGEALAPGNECLEARGQWIVIVRQEQIELKVAALQGAHALLSQPVKAVLKRSGRRLRAIEDQRKIATPVGFTVGTDESAQKPVDFRGSGGCALVLQRNAQGSVEWC